MSSENAAAGSEQEAVQRQRNAEAIAFSAIKCETGYMQVDEIVKFIEICVEAGVDASSFDSKRAFIKECDKDGNGRVDEFELSEWLVQNKGTFSLQDLGKIRVRVRVVRESKMLACERACVGSDPDEST